MNFLDHLEKARAKIGLGHLFEAAEHLGKASELVDSYGPEYQAGIDAVGALHSKVERMIANLELLAQRMDSQIIPRWSKVVISELKEPTPKTSSPKRVEIRAPLGGPSDDDGPFPEEGEKGDNDE